MPRRAHRLVRKLRSINERYRTPRIGMSPGVRAALMVLRAYLILLVLIMLYKFVTLLGA
jgi:hypothetical protein